MPVADFIFRPYQSTDAAAVMQLFADNLDPFFGPEEAVLLQQFLKKNTAYFVAEWAAGTARAGELAAAGGYARNQPYAVLTWGMVARTLHGRGLGRAFTQFRLAECARAYPGVAVEINTSQHTVGFYEKLGFRRLGITPDGFGPGLHDIHLLRA